MMKKGRHEYKTEQNEIFTEVEGQIKLTPRSSLPDKENQWYLIYAYST